MNLSVPASLINVSDLFLQSVEEMSVQCIHEDSTVSLELPYASQFVGILGICTV